MALLQSCQIDLSYDVVSRLDESNSKIKSPPILIKRTYIQPISYHSYRSVQVSQNIKTKGEKTKKTNREFESFPFFPTVH